MHANIWYIISQLAFQLQIAINCNYHCEYIYTYTYTDTYIDTQIYMDIYKIRTLYLFNIYNLRNYHKPSQYKIRETRQITTRVDNNHET